MSTVTPDGPLMSRVFRSVSELAAIRGAPPSPQQGGQPCHYRSRAQPEQRRPSSPSARTVKGGSPGLLAEN